MTKQKQTSYEVTVNFYIQAENEVDAKSTALHQSSEKYVGAPDQLSVYSRRIDTIIKLAENSIIREENINRRHWTFTLYKYLVPVVLTINATNENEAIQETRKACHDAYNGKFPFAISSVSYDLTKELGEQDIQHCQIVTRWRIVGVKEVPFVQPVDLLPQEIMHALPSYSWAEEEGTKLETAYVKYHEPVSKHTWYVLAGDCSYDILGHDDFDFYGLVIGDGKREMAEFSLSSLKDERRIGGTPVIRDVTFKPTPLSKL